MRALLDTHTFLWWCDGTREIPRKARQSIENNDCFVSLVSLWEIAIKVRLEKLTLPGEIDSYLIEQLTVNGFEVLEITFRHILGTMKLSTSRRDPFDRLLAAQAIQEDLILISRDSIFDSYGIKRIW